MPDREPASGRGPCRTRRRILGAGSARCSEPRRPRAPHHRGAVGLTEALSNWATPPFAKADYACIPEVAGARAGLPPRSPWTEAVAETFRRARAGSPGRLDDGRGDGPPVHAVVEGARVWPWSFVRLWVAVIRRHSVRA